jgi:hypothetical protein
LRSLSDFFEDTYGDDVASFLRSEGGYRSRIAQEGEISEMRLRSSSLITAVAVTVGGGIVLTHSLGTGATPALAFSAQNGQVHITKLCPAYTGAAGDHCTIATSDVTVLPPGTTVYYNQAFGIPAGNLDSNVMLYVSSGDWAVGRCTVEGATGHGLCTVSDGVGPLAGFSARINVVIDPVTGITYWDGTYSFNSLPPR